MTDGENTQAHMQGNGRVDPEPSPRLDETPDCKADPAGLHVTHLLAAERELLAECHRHGVYLAMCGAVLAVSELASNWCEPECERMVVYCPECLLDAAKHNADAGLTLDSSAYGGVGR